MIVGGWWREGHRGGRSWWEKSSGVESSVGFGSDAERSVAAGRSRVGRVAHTLRLMGRARCRRRSTIVGTVVASRGHCVA